MVAVAVSTRAFPVRPHEKARMSAPAKTANTQPRLPRYASVADLIAKMRPSTPVYALFPDKFVEAVRTFVDGFPGETLYAVKANQALPVLDHVYAAGIRHFDVASLSEVKLIRDRFPDAKQSFMAPVRLRGAAGDAYGPYGVRDFAALASTAAARASSSSPSFPHRSRVRSSTKRSRSTFVLVSWAAVFDACS